jgi:hypothetical protein
MFGWIFNISIISLLIILIFHYAFDLLENKSDNLVDLKVQKYKNIIDAMVQREKKACEEQSFFEEDNGLEELELYVKELSE